MNELRERYRQFWGLFIVQAVVMLLFGVAAIFWPGLTLSGLVFMFAAFLFVIGIVDVIISLTTIGKHSSAWITLIAGVLSLGLGVFLIKNPAVAYVTFVAFMGAILVVRGLGDMAAAIIFTKENRALLIVGAILSILAGILVWVYPAAGSLAFVWVLGLYAILHGAIDLSMVLAARDDMSKKK